MPTIEQAQAWYPTNDPVHGFDHVLRVLNLAENLAYAEGADLEIVRAAVLLHDASFNLEPAVNDQSRHEHHLASAELARKVLAEEGWPRERIAAVEHCIRAHRFRDDQELPLTLEAEVVFDADKLDAIGAIGVARAIAFAAQAGQPVYVQPSPDFLTTGQLEQGEPHSAYHELLFKLSKIKDRLYTESGRAIARERHRYMVNYFSRLKQEIDGQC